MIFLIFSFLFGLHASSLDEQQLKEFSSSKEWLRLLHYDDSNISELDGKGFFISPEGQTNPYKELKANIESFDKNIKIGKLKLHPQCAFPQRKQLIEDKLNISFKSVTCPLLEKFIQKFKNPKQVSLIFSSAYPNNPASMFGHTFLKFESERESELLDMGVNFAAFTPPNYNHLVFMYKGVFGGYPGMWSAEPYYKKVNQYINAESRDLWEYRLNLDEHETLSLIRHLWELEVNSYFDYFFIDENCSYQVLRALEAIQPHLKISNYRIYVAPGETIKSLNSTPDLVKDVKFRPSLYHQLEIKLSQLDKKGRQNALLWMQQKENDDIRPEVLSAALTGLLYQRSKLKHDWNKNHQKWEAKLLSLTASQQKAKKDLKLPDHLYKTEPTLGHDPYALFVSTGIKESSNLTETITFTRLKLRSAYHDLLANDLGYPQFSEILTPFIEVEFDNKDVFIPHLGIFTSTSLFPVTDISSEYSWKINIGAKNSPLRNCKLCLIPYTEYGRGYSLGDHNFRLYLLAMGRVQAHKKLLKGYDLEGGLEVGLLYSAQNEHKFGINFKPYYSFNLESMTHNLKASYSFNKIKNHELRSHIEFQKIHGNVNREYKEFLLQYIYYFR